MGEKAFENTADPADLEDRIKHLLVDRLRLEIEPGSIARDEALFGDGGLGLDSIDALELVVGVEQVFGVRIEDEEVGSQAFESVSALAAYIVARQASE